MWKQETYIRALEFAALAHGDQKVPGKGYSYLFHIALVSMELMTALQAEDQVKCDFALECAILHDVLEDTEVEPEQLIGHFSREVMEGVQSLTKDKQVPADRRMKDCLERIKKQPVQVWMVKMADRISNLREPPPHWSREKIYDYYGESGLILEELGQASPFLARRLAEKIDRYRKYLV